MEFVESRGREEDCAYQVDLIVPPPSVRDVIDRTAVFVGQHGLEYERRMMLEVDAAEKFGFLFVGHAYRAYYELKLREATGGPALSIERKIPEAVSKLRDLSQIKSQKAIVDADLWQRGLNPFGDLDLSRASTVAGLLEFELPHLTSKFTLTSLEEEIMRLTGRFAAVHSHNFVVGLTQRERGNPLFEFLRPNNGSNKYFKFVLDSYLRLLCMHDGREVVEPTNGRQETTSLVSHLVIDRLIEEENFRMIAGRLWHKQTEIYANARISHAGHLQNNQDDRTDWERFILVENLMFTEEDNVLPLAEACWQKTACPLDKVDVAPRGTLDDERVLTPLDPNMFHSTSPDSNEFRTIPRFGEGDSATDTAAQLQHQTTMITVDGRERKILIRPDYVRRPKRPAVAATGRLFRCPITGQILTAENMSAHMKVILLDKQWKKQRDELLARAVADSAYAPDNDIETNIADFVVRRPDLFGSVEDEIKESVNRPAEASAGQFSAIKRSRMT